MPLATITFITTERKRRFPIELSDHIDDFTERAMMHEYEAKKQVDKLKRYLAGDVIESYLTIESKMNDWK